MLTKQEILARIKALAETIHEDYAGVRPAMICILKGASPVRIKALIWHLPKSNAIFLTEFAQFIVLSSLAREFTRLETWLHNGVLAGELV